MKAYPKIARCADPFEAYVFDKIDGSNLRWEWTHELGWHKFCTQERVFDAHDNDFGEAVEIFFSCFAQPLAATAKKNLWKGCTAFTEFWGANSFAGWHNPADCKYLCLIDVDVHHQGLVHPSVLVNLRDIVPSADFIGIADWDSKFVEAVRNNKLHGITYEGVVCKAGAGANRTMAKAKTQKWVDKVHSIYPRADADRIINS